MRFLVTGAAGFIGSHLVRTLRAEGHRVVGLDRRPGADLCLDLLTDDLSPALAGQEYVIHLAGQPGVRESWQRFADYARGNIEVTQRLLEALRGWPLHKFVLASTSSVYGEAAMPAAEDGPALPVSPYGATKLAAETLCDLYGRTAGLPWVALRYFTVYGPGQRPDMAFTRWLRAVRDGGPVALYGTGEQRRDFTYVDDAVEATIRAAVANVDGLAINVGGGSSIRMLDALTAIERVTGRPLQVQRQGAAPGDMAATLADTRRLERLLAFRPQTPLEEGLRRQYEWLAGQP